MKIMDEARVSNLATEKTEEISPICVGRLINLTDFIFEDGVIFYYRRPEQLTVVSADQPEFDEDGAVELPMDNGVYYYVDNESGFWDQKIPKTKQIKLTPLKKRTDKGQRIYSLAALA